jgi:diaminohydroxyphosphoribosylaminopyrimidine deaminase/5-amino-6-(5-phosphoribosylamino)uracil reductase
MRGNNRAIGARLFAHPGNVPEGAMDSTESAMRRAIALSETALGLTSPNPIVGAVVIDESGGVIAEGFHKVAGSEHAEILALRAAGSKSVGATLVVTLEPCSHSGKTPPCVAAIIESGIKRVVYSVTDPNPIAAGGSEKLKAAGIEVVSGVLKKEAEFSNRAWLKKIKTGRPFVTLKMATSVDGRSAASDGNSKWITTPQSRQDVAHLRSECDAIVTGTGTVLADNPRLSVRGINRIDMNFAPVRVILGSRALSKDLQVFNDEAETLEIKSKNLSQFIDLAMERGWNRILVEAGPKLSSAFLELDLVDEVLIYLAPTFLGGSNTAIEDIGVENLVSGKQFDFFDVKRIPGEMENLRIQLLVKSA